MTQNRSNFADAYREINEKLKPSDGAGAYVKDFKKSDAPQFKGKSDEKKQDMAIAAYLDDKDKTKKEEVNSENIFEDRKIMISTKDKKIEKDIVMMVKKNNLGISLSKSSKGITADGNTKDLTKLVDGLFDKHMSKIINPNNPPFEIRMENLDEAKFAVKLSFLPKPIYVDSESAGKVKMQMRKALKKPEDIESVERVMPADYKSDLRNRIKGKKDDEDGEEKTEALKTEELEEKFKPEGGELFVVTAGQGDNAQKVIGMNKNLRKAQKMRDDYDRKNKPSKPSHKARVYAQSKQSQPKNKFKVGDDIKYSSYGNKLQFTKIKEMKFDEPEFSKKNFAFNRIGLVAKDLKKKELGKVTDEGRKSKHDMDQDDEEGANKNIIMQLRKSVDLKGRFDVEFENGPKVKVKDTIARAAVLKHAGFRRPAEKLAFQQKIEKSYRDLLNALKGR